jgi:PAS domain S-box-containing protein
MTGYEQEEIDGRGQYALFHPDDEARSEADVQRVIEGESSSEEYRIITKAGEARWVHIFRQPEWDEAHQRVIRMYGVAQDVTERKRSEEELRKSEEKYRLIAENATDMIASTGTDGICMYVSSVCRTLLGFAPEEMIGQPVMSFIHDDHHPDVNSFFAVLERSSEPMTITCRLWHKNGDFSWFEITAQVIRDPDTKAAKEYVTVARDISQRKQMETILLEQERLRLELQKEQELNEVKSNLMRTISHEFRTPLTLIVTATDFLDTYIERLSTERRKERLQAIRVQVNHMSNMLDDISFVVQGTLHHMIAHPSRLNLEAYCRTVLEEIQMAVGKDHQFIFTTDGQLQNGIADKALIVRIMGNLVSNAVKYSPENSVITVMLYRSGDDATLQVSDQGIGIDEDEQKHVFEPFYRGSSVIDSVGGTGLGLSIVKDCVDLHHGTIRVESAPGKGTTFIVGLPQNFDYDA